MEIVQNVRRICMQKILKSSLICLVVLLLICMTSCTSCIEKKGNKIKVITTLYPQYEITKFLLQDEEISKFFEVSLLLAPGADTHTFDPSVQDILSLRKSNLVIYTGDQIEPWISGLNLQNTTEVIDLSSDERIKLLDIEGDIHGDHNDHDHDVDPHYFVYPIYIKYMAENIKNKLVELVPSGYGEKVEFIEKRYIEFAAEIDKIDLAIKQIVLNAKNKTLYFASPFTFYYFTKLYGLNYYLTYQTCSTEVEPSMDKILEVIKSIKDNKVKYIYVKELVSLSAANMISEKTDATILTLYTGNTVSASQFGKDEYSLLSLLKKNVYTLATGLEVNLEDLESFPFR